MILVNVLTAFSRLIACHGGRISRRTGFCLATAVVAAMAVTTGSVHAQDLPPIAVDDIGFAFGTQPAVIDVLDNDSDPIGAAISIASVNQPPAGGTVAIVGDHLLFTPTVAVSSPIVFQYTLQNRLGLTAVATVTIQRGFAASGVYAGLLNSGGPNPQVRGLFIYTFSRTSGTGTLLVDGKHYGMRITIGASPVTYPLLDTHAGFLTSITLSLGPADANGYPTITVVTPGLADAQTLTGVAEHSPFDSHHPTSRAGMYTFVAEPTVPTTPSNIAAAMNIVVKPSGSVRFKGHTGDGVTANLGTVLLSNGRIPFYNAASPANPLETLGGMPVIGTGVAPQVDGSLKWVIPAGANPHHPGAIDADYTVIGARYTPVPTGNGMLTLNASGDLVADANFPSAPEVRVACNIGATNVKISGNINTLINLAPGSGLFSGTVGRKGPSIWGAMMQGPILNFGAGSVLDRSGGLGTLVLTPGTGVTPPPP